MAEKLDTVDSVRIAGGGGGGVDSIPDATSTASDQYKLDPSPYKHVMLDFLTENLDDADTITLDTTGGRIVKVAWETQQTADLVALTHDGTTITCQATNADNVGVVHVWLTN